VAGTRVELVRADVTQPGLLTDLDGRVDLLVANPPYIPEGVALEPEVAQHDPSHALFGGPDGMAVIDHIVELAARWLRDGGRCAVEHDDTTSARTVEAFARAGRFDDIVARHDLTGRPRFVTATRNGEKLAS
jgi:release factor glutamine methyltransferase